VISDAPDQRFPKIAKSRNPQITNPQITNHQIANHQIIDSPDQLTHRAPVVVALLTIELFIPGAHSLKEKRMVLRRIKDRLKKFNVAVSEVGHHDLWQRAGLAVVTVSTDQPHADRELAAVVDEIERVEPGLTRSDVEFLA
jgi:uncharacterized protein YlxP (DUF503 family)